MTSEQHAEVLAELRALRELLLPARPALESVHLEAQSIPLQAHVAPELLADSVAVEATDFVNMSRFNRRWLSVDRGILASLNRLCELVALTPGERAFVSEGLDAAHRGDPVAAWDAAGVLGDYYEDMGHADIAARLQWLRPQTNDVLVLQVARDAGPHVLRQAIAGAKKAIIQPLRERGIDVLFAGAYTGELSSMSIEDMAAQGWVWREDAEQAVRDEREACLGIVEREIADTSNTLHGLTGTKHEQEFRHEMNRLRTCEYLAGLIRARNEEGGE